MGHAVAFHHRYPDSDVYLFYSYGGDGVDGAVGNVVDAAFRARRIAGKEQGLDEVIDGLSRYLTALPAVEAAALMPRDARTLARLFPVLQIEPVTRTRPAFGAVHTRTESWLTSGC